jgi:hypothetical protein
MRFWERLQATFAGRQPFSALAKRRARREAGRRRHRETGAPPWTNEDRHLNDDGEQWVADISPGTPGHFGSVRTAKNN